MRRILLLLAGAAVLTLPAAATARPQSRTAPGYLVVRDAATDRGVAGRPVATVVVHGFVLGHVAQEGAVRVYQLSGSLAAQVAGVDVSRRAVTYRHRVAGTEYVVHGTEFSGSDFRFRAVGGVWRIVVYGAGISLYAAGEGKVSLHGSATYPNADGVYSLNGGPSVSLPAGTVTRKLEGK